MNTAAGGTGSFTVYSIDANRRVSTNVFTATGPKELENTKGKIHILPVAAPVTVVTNRASKTTRVVLPMQVGLTVDTGGPNDTAVIRFGEVFLEALESPVRWSAAARAYVTTLAVGLDFPEHPEIGQLPVPVTFALIGRNATASRNEVSVRKAGPPYEQVQLTVSDARADASVTAHHPLVKDKPLTLDCAIELDTLTVDAKESMIAGFGLGSTPLTVRRIAKDQSEIADATSLEVVVSFASGKGKLESGTLTIPPNASKVETELRSVGVGQTVVAASVGGVIGKSRIIKYYVPIGLIVATLLGGPLGGAARYIWQRKNKTTKAFAGRFILGGTLCGVLIVAAALAGIVIFALPPTVLATELGVFLTAALAGYSGAPVLEKLMNHFAK
ncbi:MAG: hypothetical protein NT154_33535 [Verrucomicrobia bacterium]|nr:hypothetical protein [Verrucomicrobiota bacterium]